MKSSIDELLEMIDIPIEEEDESFADYPIMYLKRAPMHWNRNTTIF